MPDKRRKNEKTDFFPKTRIHTILDKSLWDSTAIFIFFLSFLGFLLKQCILFENFLQFSLPAPYTKLKLGKNSGYTRPTLFVGRGKGVDLCELKTPQKCKSVSRLLSMIVDKHSYPRALYFNLKIQMKCMYMCL